MWIPWPIAFFPINCKLYTSKSIISTIACMLAVASKVYFHLPLIRCSLWHSMLLFHINSIEPYLIQKSSVPSIWDFIELGTFFQVFIYFWILNDKNWLDNCLDDGGVCLGVKWENILCSVHLYFLYILCKLSGIPPRNSRNLLKLDVRNALRQKFWTHFTANFESPKMRQNLENKNLSQHFRN